MIFWFTFFASKNYAKENRCMHEMDFLAATFLCHLMSSPPIKYSLEFHFGAKIHYANDDGNKTTLWKRNQHFMAHFSFHLVCTILVHRENKGTKQ